VFSFHNKNFFHICLNSWFRLVPFPSIFVRLFFPFNEKKNHKKTQAYKETWPLEQKKMNKVHVTENIRDIETAKDNVPQQDPAYTF